VLLDTFKPTFLIQIEGQTLAKGITQEITEFAFEDNEEELDVMEMSITDRNLQFVDDPLFQQGNEIVARFRYFDALSPRKVAVIKDIDYDFPESGDPTIRIKAYDKAFKLAGMERLGIAKYLPCLVPAPRSGVPRRKRSFGTISDSDARLAERRPTADVTLRLHRHDLLGIVAGAIAGNHFPPLPDRCPAGT